MFGAATGAVDVADLNPTAMKYWLLSLRQRGLSANSLVNYDRALRVFANWLHWNGYTATNPLATLPKPRPSSTNVMTLDTTDIRKLTEAARRSRQPQRNLALISLLIDTGIRSGEASSLHVGAISWSEGTLAMSGKTGARAKGKALRERSTLPNTGGVFFRSGGCLG
jgi:site-specific recombinase XerD